jgi:signal transduction histidine kinase
LRIANLQLDPAARRAWISAGAPILALVGVVLLLAFTLVASFARTQDENFRQESRRLVQGAIDGRVHAVSNLTLDYAMWDDAYANVTRRWNARWIEDNFYSAVANALIIMRADGTIRYTWTMDGESASLATDAAGAVLALTRLPAPEEAQNENLVATTGFSHNGNATIVAVAPISFEDASARQARDPSRPTDYLLIVDVIDEQELATIGHSLDLESFSFGATPPAGHVVTFAPGRNELGVLSWRDERPGSAAFALQMAPIVACLFLVGALTILVSRKLVAANIQSAARAESALESSRLRAEFIATMSHELRTPLNAIIGYSELIEETASDTPVGATIRTDAGRVLSAARHLRQLVTDILDHSRIDSGRLRLSIENVAVAGALAEAAEFAEPLAASQGISFSIADETGGADVAADDIRLRQCLINLVGNAIKFTRDGHVRLKARVEHRAEGAFIVFDVVDTGIGIEPSVLARLFQPFVQANEQIQLRYGGTGLGLSISQKLARAMGGVITATSELGKGSTFSLALPAARKSLRAA